MDSIHNLCATCRNIDFKNLLIRRFHLNSSRSQPITLGSLEDIRRRSSSCRLCQLVASTASHKWEDYIDPQSIWGRRLILTENQTPSVACAIYPHSSYAKFSVDNVELSCYEIVIKMGLLHDSLTHFDLLRIVPCERPVSTSTAPFEGTQRSLKFPSGRLVEQTIDSRLPKYWMETCLAGHKDACASPDWFVDDGECLDVLCLIDVEERCLVSMPLKTNYLALSYVWGLPKGEKIEWLSLKNHHLLKMAGALADDHVPQTIRDSMILTKELGYKYLWVDRYCIIQDDENSLARYIPKMDDIFAYAILTIIAANGSTVYDGLAGMSKNRGIVQKMVNINDEFGLLIVPEMQQSVLENSKWRTRGWTLQEQMCSRRQLIITEGSLHWICERSRWAEHIALEPGINDFIVTGTPSRIYDDYHKMLDTKFKAENLAALISNFMTRQLTIDSDAADAFAGLVRRFKKCTGIECYWGHPLSERFGYSLIWDFNYTTTITRRDDLCPLRLDGKAYHIPFPRWSWMGWKDLIGKRFRSLATRDPTDIGLEFYRLDIHGKAQKLTLLSNPVQRPRWMGEDTRIPQSMMWKGSTFEDSGRLLFWTSHARFRIETKTVSRNINSMFSQVIGELAGQLFVTSPFDEAELHSFIVCSRIDGQSRGRDAGENYVNVLLVSWEDEENHVAHRLRGGEICTSAWIAAKPDWILCTLT